MPDDIRQNLEFNASQTFNELARIEQAFKTFGSTMGTVATRIDSFNKEAGRVVAALKAMETQANATFAAMAKVGGIPAGAGTGASSVATKMSADAREAARVFEQTRTPLERYNTQIGRLDALSQKGAISQDTHTRAMDAARTKLDAAGQAAQKFTISWETLTRVVVTQAIVRILSLLRDGLSEAISGFMDFSKRVGEIRAIDPGRTFVEIAADVRVMSDAFNQPLDRVAEAQYQTISDQFVTAADRANILTAANMLSKVTVQDLATSAQLLTGALNAYSESSDMAGLRAAQFNLAIDLGRLRTQELGAALGRTQGVAHELGLSMEELDASLIAITIGGVKATEAATQLRSMMSAMMKPSDAMKAALKSLGVESGQAAIQTWGWQGALQRVVGTTDGSAAAVAGLFQNIRALPGALRLAGSGAEKYKEALDKLNQVDVDVLRKKTAEFISTDAERLTAEMTKISNYFKTEFGQDVVHSFSQITDLIGVGLVPAVRILTKELTTFGVTAGLVLGAVAARFLYLKATVGLSATAIVGVRAAMLAIAGIPLAVSVGELLGNMLGNLATAPLKAIRAAGELETKANEEKTAAAIRIADRKNEELLRGLRQYAATAQKLYFKDADNLKNAMNTEVKIATSALDRIMQKRQGMVTELLAMADRANKRKDEIPSDRLATQGSIADRDLQMSMLGKDSETQIRTLTARARAVAGQAWEMMTRAGSEAQVKQAEAEFKRGEALAHQAAQLMAQSDDISVQRKGLQLLNELDGKRLGLLDAEESAQTRIAAKSQEAANEMQRQNDELVRKARAIEDSLSLVKKDAEGALRPKTGAELTADIEKSRELIGDFAVDLQKLAGPDFSKAFGSYSGAFAQMRREAERQATGADIQTLRATPEALAYLNEQLQAGLNKMRLEAPVIVKLEEITGKDLLADGLTKIVDTFQKQLSEATARGLQGALMQAALASSAAQQKAISQVTEKAIPKIPSGMVYAPDSIIGQGREHLLVTLGVMTRLGQATKITENELARLEDLLKGVDVSLANSGLGGSAKVRIKQGLLDSYENVLKRTQLLKQQAAEAEAAKGKPTQEQLAPIQSGILELNKKTVAEGDAAKMAERSAQAASATSDAIGAQTSGVQQGLPAVASLEASWWRVAAAAQAAAQAASAAAAGGGASMDITGTGFTFEDLGYAAGGIARRHFDRGGFAPRGVDMVPAMLSPGEFVMSPRATKQFYGQLVAMNAGVTPNFRSQGGSTTNVGDIAINVTAAGEPEQNARAVLRALHREVRRGVGRPF